MKKIALTGAAVLIAVVGFAYARSLVGRDAFAGFAQGEESSADMAIRLSDVDLKQYKGGKLVSQAEIDEMEVSRDKRFFDLSNVHNGVYYGEDGTIQFTADSAKWDAGKLELLVDSGANIKSKDFDLDVPSFSIDKRNEEMVVPREIKGKLFGGSIAARDFRYKLKDGSFRVGPAEWQGQVDPSGDAQPSQWKFKVEGGTSSSGGIETWNDATATDGDVVVQGDKIERNRKTDVLTVTGKVLFFSKKANLAADKAVVYRKEKRAVLTGNVRMLIKPKDSMERELKVDTGEIPPFRPVVPDEVASNRPEAAESEQEKKLNEEIRSAETTRRYPTVVLSEKIEYWYGKGDRRAVISGKPQASQQLAGTRWRKVWASTAHYNGQSEKLRLISTDGKKDVRMKTSLGDDILAAWFEISTKEGDDSYTGGAMSGVVVPDEDEDLPTDEEKPAPTEPEKSEPEPSPPSPTAPSR